ncbi:3-isopropylmalate dehydratase [Chloroflexota bacterium]
MKLGRGKAWVFDGVLDVDWQMVEFTGAAKARATVQSAAVDPLSRQVIDEEAYAKEYAKYLLTPIDPDFPKKVKPGDYLVGNKGLGYGHDHDGPCIAMKGAGIAGIICEAISANFKRNCVFRGIPVVIAKGIMDATKTGDELEVDLAAGTMKNLTSGKELRFAPYPDFLIEIIQAGGVYPLLKSMAAAGKV